MEYILAKLISEKAGVFEKNLHLYPDNVPIVIVDLIHKDERTKSLDVV